MHKKILMVLLVLSLLVSFSVVPGAHGERATQEEMEQVCQNWLSYMAYQKGAWAGETLPQIIDVDEILESDTVLARCFSISPRGFVVVPILKELPPIKAYSEKYGLDVDERDGFAKLLKEVLLDRVRRYAKIYGSLDAIQPATGEVLLGRGHKAGWDRFLKSEEEFKTDLIQGKFQTLTEAGPLLTTSWHQYAPYNSLCPMGDQDCDVCPSGKPPTFPTVVGCVATAAAQIMKYWNWPPSGTGSHSYTWGGDQSCDGSTPPQLLSATFSDPYDWQNMPDHCESGCSFLEQDALAELCYEVGVAFHMDYGVCGSGTWTYMALTVFPTYFRYDSSIDREDRDDHTPAEWFSIIQTEIDSGRPIQYRISRHSIVCDGWRDTGGQNQFHMNYGWGGSFTTWYVIDSLYCRWEPDSLCPPMEEYLIRYIMPDTSSVILVKPDGTGDYPTIQAAIDAASSGDTILLTNGTFTGDGNRDIDFLGKAITLRSQGGDQELCIIDCQTVGRGFYFHSSEGSGSVLKGVTIMNGSADIGGGIYCTDGSSPTLIDVTFSGNIAGCGGGVLCSHSSPILTGCTFSGNVGAAGYGGGIDCFNSSTTLIECTFSGNSAMFGGGMYCEEDSTLVTNCTFFDNLANSGSGIYCSDNSSPELENTIIAFGSYGEAVYCVETSDATLTCCDVYGNDGGNYVGCIADQEGINGNFSADPLFCDPDKGDYHLLDVSPCAPAQQPECDLIGALDTGCDQAPPVTMPITETGTDIPFVYGSDTLAILNFVTEDLKYVIIEAEKGTLPPDLPEGTSWVHRYYSITPISEGAGFEAAMTLFYSQSEFHVSGLSDESNLGLCRYEDSDSTWTFEGGIVDTEENSITSSGVTDFSIWGITDSSNTSPMIRGDANRSGSVDLADAVFIVNWLFIGGPAPNPLWLGDANSSGGVDLADAVYIVNWLFIGGPPPGCE